MNLTFVSLVLPTEDTNLKRNARGGLMLLVNIVPGGTVFEGRARPVMIITFWYLLCTHTQ